ncbi:MAG: hypothetical protein RUDDFDWM_001679 [Candidatus Fervidibacterota bacterium]
MWVVLLKHFLDMMIFAILAFIACGFGVRVLILLRVKCAHKVEAIMCAIGIGFAVLSYGVFLVGVLGWLNRTAVLVLLGLMLLVSVPSIGAVRRKLIVNIYEQIPQVLPKISSSHSPLELAMTTLCIFISILVLIGALSPPTAVEWDSLSYHLAIPKLYLEAKRIYFVQFTSHASFPFTTEMLYTVGLALSGHSLAKLFHFFFFLGCCVLLLCIGNSIALKIWRDASDKESPNQLPSPVRSAWASAWTLFTIPIAVAEASTAYVDIALSFYGLLAVLAALRWLENKSFGWLMLCAISCGLCMGIKYSGIIMLFLPVGLFLFHTAVAKQNFLKGTASILKACLSQFFLPLIVAVIVASPWYVKNIITTGNPFFPFFYEVFGGRGWNKKMAEQYRKHQLEFGTERTPLQLLLALWNLTMHSDIPKELMPTGKPKPFRYEVEPNPTSGIGLTFLAFLPTLVFMRPISPYALLLLALCAVWFLAWFFSVQYLRYLLPCLIMLCGIVGYAYSHWFEKYPLTRVSAQVAMLCALSYSTLIAIAWVLPCAPVVFGIISEDEYLQQTLPAYAIAKYINVYLPTDAKVITYGEPLCYYFERDYLWGDPGHNLLIDYAKVASSSKPMLALFEEYRKLGVTHILLNRRYFSLSQEGVPNGVIRMAIKLGVLKQLTSVMGEELYEIDWDALRKIK